ncbi:hypothetical protein HPT25_07325 [Bacillus sp. BRMEA1]|uniref:hypothetical protein n=1 Tax=Neobacillus endophyticus TaxID=2738405 RepID=UPI0015679852|nr:hypothetical protein [Neobacillus endophyticus]NRD77308.1 hypothetical protein [Neobacillus endophyticus]
MELLTKQEVHKYMSLLSEEQRTFLLEHGKQSKKSKWLEVLARNKGITFHEDMSTEELEKLIDDWVLVEVLDSGYGNKNYRCICGTPLRYQYIVHNKKNGETVGLGVKCFENHTMLPNQVVRDILKEFHHIDLERDEILHKVVFSEYFDIKPYLYIDSIPESILQQAQLHLPLTNKQIALIENLKHSYDINVMYEKAINSLKPEARGFLEDLPGHIKDELLDKLVNCEDMQVAIPDGFHDEEIELLLSLELPILDIQLEQIFEYRRQKNWETERKREEEQRELFQLWSADTSLPKRIKSTETTLDYDTLIERHLETLKKVRAKENELSEGMKRDWAKVENMVRLCSKGNDFDYSSFKLNLSMICMSVRITGDRYL